jgi:hypothetical protein
MLTKIFIKKANEEDGPAESGNGMASLIIGPVENLLSTQRHTPYRNDEQFSSNNSNLLLFWALSFRTARVFGSKTNQPYLFISLFFFLSLIFLHYRFRDNSRFIFFYFS